MNRLCKYIFIAFLLIASVAKAQEGLDSIIETEFLKAQITLLSDEIDSIKVIISTQKEQISRMESEKYALQRINDTLELINGEFRTQLNDKNLLLEEQIKVLQQKEILFAEKELLYKEAISNSNIDKVKIEGSLQAKNASIAGKEKEIEYLEKSIGDKEKSIGEKDRQLSVATSEKDKYSQMTDTLREQLVIAEKELLKINEELKYTKKRADEAEAKIAQAVSRKKKVRVIQGISMRFYPIPEWDIMPFIDTDGKLHNKIVNRNDGFVEFDFVTGASVMLLDFNKPNDRFSSDLGLYVGFGGQNLFKNFYVGANYKFLDFFHLTCGLNIAQYHLLADDYKVGMQLPDGFAIQTKKQWKVTPFISLSLDLEFLSYIGKK
ncbi:MAG: hypothetical protein LBO06_06975 [Bacteroidales bacterium]|jgi:hypothetical protein|nr:hypothetical protein [Bacteroidales bacterium]